MRSTNWELTPTQRYDYAKAIRQGRLSGRCLTLPGQWISYIDPQSDGCWKWTGPGSVYGQFLNRGVHHLAHRTAYELLIGPIPAGLQIDHLCRNTRCVNPTHLEPVTGRVNYLRGTSPMAENARKTHCKRGHPFTDANTYRSVRKPTMRQCRSCAAFRHRQSYAQRVAQR